MAKMYNQKYTLLMSEVTQKKVIAYKQDLLTGTKKPGKYLNEVLACKLLSEMTKDQFLSNILATKKPKIFADRKIIGSGVDWNNDELSILGDINVGVPVTIYDNMGWNDIIVHAKPFEGELLYSPGCLLEGSGFKGGAKALPDYKEVIENDCEINQMAYNQLVSRRLFPVIKYASERSTPDQKAIINVPGLGCGIFAGKFIGKIGKHLDIALQTLLLLHYNDLPNIALVRFDSFNECRDQQVPEKQFGSIIYRVRPLPDNPGKTQLCYPTAYQEKNDDFSNCKLFKVVAWDHVSLPGNSFWVGNRATDDGIAAAATDSMNAFTTEKGYYDSDRKKFVMLDGDDNWLKSNPSPLIVTDNLMVFSPTSTSE